MTSEEREVRQAGPLLDGWEIARAVAQCLYMRLPSWLDEVARQQGDPDGVQRPAWVGLMTNEEELPKGMFPRVMVATQSGAAEYRSDGEAWARWDVRVAAMVDVTRLEVAVHLASVYAAAIAACVGIHAVEHLDQIADVRWLGGPVQATEPTGAITAQRFEVLAGPAFALSGHLDPLPEDPPPGPVDQGDSPVITHTNLDLSATTGRPTG